MASGRKRAQRAAATGALQPAAAVAQVERLAHPAGDPTEARDTLRSRRLQHVVKAANSSPQATSDLGLNLHAADKAPIVQPDPQGDQGNSA